MQRLRTSSYRSITCAAGAVVVLLCGGVVPAAQGHGAASREYEAVITAVRPDTPIDVTIEDGDRIRFENQGDELLELCGYTNACEQYVRIDEDGVQVNHDSEAYFANQDKQQAAPVPESAGEGPPKWVEAGSKPEFSYHDHRIHWMSKTPPAGVDESRPGRQKVTDWSIAYRYGGRDGTVEGTLYYVGGQTFLQRYGEVLITVAGIAAMLVVFGLDARRRRARRADAANVGATGGSLEQSRRSSPTPPT